jgi:hypothetical protein
VEPRKMGLHVEKSASDIVQILEEEFGTEEEAER